MLQKNIRLFIIFGLFLIVSGSLSAQQNAWELRLGSIISGNLGSGEEIWYRVNAAENCFLTIETLGSTDTYLEVYDSQNNLLMENDDGGNGENAKIEMLASRGSRYLVKLKGFGDSSGSFRILLDSQPLPNIIDLNAGSLLSGSLSTGQRQFYRVQSAGTGLLTIETTGTMDTYLEAYDSQFRPIASDDDSGEGNNARIELFTEARQVYYFMVRGYGDSSGSYRILAGFEAMTVANNTSRSTAAALALGEAIPVFLATGQSRWYVYQITKPGIITFVVQTSGNMDTWLNLYDKDGNLLEENDDSSDENLNACISTRLNAGTYYIEVKGFGNESGRCTLHAEIK